MRLQVCGTSVKIPHISLAEMKKNVNMKTLLSPHEQRMRKLNTTSDKTSSLSPWNEMWDKRKDIKCKLQMEKKLTGRVLVVNNTSTHCSNNNVALNVSRLQLCGVSKKKKSMLPSDGGLWELHPTNQNMTNGIFLNTSQVKCIYDLSFFKAIVISVSDEPSPLSPPPIRKDMKVQLGPELLLITLNIKHVQIIWYR